MFSTKQPLPREDAIRVFETSLKVCVAYFSPYGLPPSVVRYVGVADESDEPYALISVLHNSFEQIVDQVMDLVCEAYGFSISQVTSSIETYSADPQFQHTMNLLKNGLNKLFNVPVVLDLPDEDPQQVLQRWLDAVKGLHGIRNARGVFPCSTRSVPFNLETVGQSYEMNTTFNLHDDVKLKFPRIFEAVRAYPYDIEQVWAISSAFATDKSHVLREMILNNMKTTLIYDECCELIDVLHSCLHVSEDGTITPPYSGEVALQWLTELNESLNGFPDLLKAFNVNQVDLLRDSVDELIKNAWGVLPDSYLSKLFVVKMKVMTDDLQNNEAAQADVDPAALLQYCEAALRCDPTSLYAWTYRAEILHSLASNEVMVAQALEAIRYAIQLGGLHHPEHARVIELTARDLFKHLVDSTPINPTVRSVFPSNCVFQAYFSSFQFERSLTSLADIQDLSGDVLPCLSPLFMSLLSVDEQCPDAHLESGIQALKRYLTLRNRNEYTPAWVDLQAAVVSFEQMHQHTMGEKDENHALANHLLGIALNQRGSYNYVIGDLQAAKHDFNKSLEHYRFPNTYIKKALVALDDSDKTEALRLLDSVIQWTPDEDADFDVYSEDDAADAYLHRAQFHLVSENMPQAIQDSTNSMSLNHALPGTWATLALSVFKMSMAVGGGSPESFMQSVHLLSTAREKFPEDMDVLMYLGDVYSQMGAIQESIRCFKEAFELDSTSAMPYVHAGK